jgi:phenylpyruvate tautomerase PptA (4-oxalocrotonate tautomerase family)
MPLLKVLTNVEVPPDRREGLLAAASRAVAGMLGKPERYVMVTLETGVPMIFAGSHAPCAFLELKSIGLPEDRTAALSQALCDALGPLLQVAPERTYIEFTNAEPHLWGWNAETF